MGLISRVSSRTYRCMNTFQRLYQQASQDVPLVYEKLTQTCENCDDVFSNFSYSELLDGRHFVEVVIGDRYFKHLGCETKQAAKDHIAQTIFEQYGVKKPLKDPAAALIFQTNVMTLWNPVSVMQQFLADRVTIGFAGETELTYKLDAKYTPPAENGGLPGQPKRAKTEILVGESFGSSAADAHYKIGVVVLKSEKFMEAYVKWIKGGKKGCFEEVDNEETDDPMFGLTKLEKSEISDSAHLHELKILCEAYELEAPEYFKDKDNNFTCSVSSKNVNQYLEGAAKLAFEHLLEICQCRDRLLAEKISAQEFERQEKMAKRIQEAADRKRMQEICTQKKAVEKAERYQNHLKFIEDAKIRKREKLEKKWKETIEKKKRALIYANKEVPEDLEEKLRIDLAAGLSETVILQDIYEPGTMEAAVVEKNLKLKEEREARHLAHMERIQKAKEDKIERRAVEQAIQLKRREEKEMKRL